MLKRHNASGEMAGYHRVKGGRTPIRNKGITMHTITYRRKHDNEEVMCHSEDITEVFKMIETLTSEGYKFEHIFEER